MGVQTRSLHSQAFTKRRGNGNILWWIYVLWSFAGFLSQCHGSVEHQKAFLEHCTEHGHGGWWPEWVVLSHAEPLVELGVLSKTTTGRTPI